MANTHDEVFYVIRVISGPDGYVRYHTGHYSGTTPKLYRLRDAARVIKQLRLSRGIWNGAVYQIVPTTLCFGEPTTD